MHPTQTDPVVEVLRQVRVWPAEKRLALVQQVLQTLQYDLGSQPPRSKSIKDLLGILQTEGPPPSDDECQRILEEELLRKHAS